MESEDLETVLAETAELRRAVDAFIDELFLGDVPVIVPDAAAHHYGVVGLFEHLALKTLKPSAFVDYRNALRTYLKHLKEAYPHISVADL